MARHYTLPPTEYDYDEIFNQQEENEAQLQLLNDPHIVSIPSCIRYWWREYKIRKGLGNTLPPYDRIWFEGWATRLGEKHFN